MELIIHFTALPEKLTLDMVKSDLAELLEDDGWLTGSGADYLELELEDEKVNPKYGILTVKGYLQKARLWADVARQDAAALREWFAPEAEVYWHCTDERFTAEEYIRANCEYPGDWEGAVERAEWTEDGCVSVTAVWPKDRSARFHAVSFFRFAEDRITRLDEYWADDGPPPQWRKEKHIGSSIGRS